MKKKYLQSALKLAIATGLVIAFTACGGSETNGAEESDWEEIMAQALEERGQEHAEILTELIAGEPTRFINLANENRWATTISTMTSEQREQVTGASLVDGVFHVDILPTDLSVYADTVGIWGMHHPASMITGTLAIEIMNMFKSANMDDYWDSIVINIENIGGITIPKYLATESIGLHGTPTWSLDTDFIWAHFEKTLEHLWWGHEGLPDGFDRTALNDIDESLGFTYQTFISDFNRYMEAHYAESGTHTLLSTQNAPNFQNNFASIYINDDLAFALRINSNGELTSITLISTDSGSEHGLVNTITAMAYTLLAVSSTIPDTTITDLWTEGEILEIDGIQYSIQDNASLGVWLTINPA